MAIGVTIQLDSAKMRGAVQVLENQLSIIRNCYEGIRGDATSLRSTHWDSVSAENYIETIRTLCNEEQVSDNVSAGSIIRILQAYVNDLTLTVDEFSRTEDKIIANVENLPTTAFGV